MARATGARNSSDPSDSPEGSSLALAVLPEVPSVTPIRIPLPDCFPEPHVLQVPLTQADARSWVGLGDAAVTETGHHLQGAHWLVGGAETALHLASFSHL